MTTRSIAGLLGRAGRLVRAALVAATADRAVVPPLGHYPVDRAA